MLRSMLPTLLLLSACASNGPELTTDGFDVSCETVDDCIAVLIGDVCGCECTYGAINAGEAESWAEYDAEARERCEDVMQCGPCGDPDEFSCDDGVCSAVQYVY